MPSKIFRFSACVAVLLFAAGAGAQAGGRDVAHGIFHDYNAEGGWVVIDDQAMVAAPGLPVRDARGGAVSALEDIEPGTPVRYVYRIRDRVWHVARISLIQQLPPANDEEGVSDR